MSYCDIGPTMYDAREHFARKPHKCCECSAQIDVGEKYLYCVGVWEGKLSSHRQHLLCQSACEYVRDNILDDCLPFGGLKEWWGEEGHFGRKDAPEYVALRKILAQIYRSERARKS